MGTTKDQYNKLVNFLTEDEKVIGLWLSGSRGKGYHDDRSDYDLWVVVGEESNIPDLQERIKSFKLSPDIGTTFKTLKGLKEYARWGRHDFWVRYSFTDTKPFLDRTGELQKVIDKIGTFPIDKQKGLIRGALGAYQNSLYRSLKAYYRGRTFAAIIEANHSIEHLLVALFALHKRFKPYNDYLEKEIGKLTLLGQKQTTFMDNIMRVITSAEPDTQLQLKSELEVVFRDNDFGESFDEWDETFKGFVNKYQKKPGA